MIMGIISERNVFTNERKGEHTRRYTPRKLWANVGRCYPPRLRMRIMKYMKGVNITRKGRGSLASPPSMNKTRKPVRLTYNKT